MAKKTPLTRIERYIRLIQNEGLQLAPAAVQAVVLNSRLKDSVLMVHSPGYEPHWTLPGGEVDAEDVDLEHALLREFGEELGTEELGADVAVGPLRAININAPNDSRGRPFELIDYLYEVDITGGPASMYLRRPTFRLQADEIAAVEYVPLEQAPERAGSRKGGRLKGALEAHTNDSLVRLQDGVAIPQREYARHAERVAYLNSAGMDYYLAELEKARTRLTR
ncbi:MAG: NUDIX hydrolase [Corynebacteriales bacterium]|nr:NUDIX hydrolase [Mycobacteriales bacterium]